MIEHKIESCEECGKTYGWCEHTMVLASELVLDQEIRDRMGW